MKHALTTALTVLVIAVPAAWGIGEREATNASLRSRVAKLERQMRAVRVQAGRVESRAVATDLDLDCLTAMPVAHRVGYMAQAPDRSYYLTTALDVVQYGGTSETYVAYVSKNCLRRFGSP